MTQIPFRLIISNQMVGVVAYQFFRVLLQPQTQRPRMLYEFELTDEDTNQTYQMRLCFIPVVGTLLERKGIQYRIMELTLPLMMVGEALELSKATIAVRISRA